MAILLIILNDKTHNTNHPAKLAKRGDVVGVFGDNHVFGRRESIIQWVADGFDEVDYPAHYLIMKLPKTVAQVEGWMAKNNLDSTWLDDVSNPKFLWSVDLTGLSHDQFKFNVTLAQWDNFKSRVRHKRDDNTLTDRGV
tara:strand:- start:3394 stop:3810 length:417 start_codon:yes stop_codon:yes gene_type:complete